MGRAIRPVPFSGTDLQRCCEFSILLANPITCGVNSLGCLLMRMLMVCREGLCIPHPDQCTSAVLLSWALRGWDPIPSHFGIVTPPVHGTLTIDLRGVCAQGYPLPWLCPGVPLLCDTASGDAAAQLLGSPFVLPIRREDRHFPVSCSGVISSSVQSCLRLPCLSFVHRSQLMLADIADWHI